MAIAAFAVGIARVTTQRSAWILFVAAAILGGAAPTSAIQLTATPNVIRPTNGKLPASITITVQPTTDQECNSVDLQNTKITLTIAGNAGIALSSQATSRGKCILAYTATVDPNAPPGTYKLLLTDETDDKNKKVLGSADLTVADPNAGPVPPGLQPGVDVLWQVMSQKKCMDVFGARVGQFNYCIQLKLGNNSGYPLQVAGIGFSHDMNPDNTQPDTTIANSSYASTRAVLLTENYTNGRNIAYNIIRAIGVLMPAFSPYFGTTHANGTVNNARVHWSTAASIVSGPLLQAFDIIAPNPVITQLNQLDDQSFRDNLTIANNVQIQTVVFVEKQALTNQLIKLNCTGNQNCRDELAKRAQQWNDLGLANSTSSMQSTISNSTNNRAVFSTKGGFNPDYVKQALGNVVIVGRHIAYLERVHVVNSANSPSGAAPMISKVTLPAGVDAAVTGTEITISGSNFGTTKGTSTVQIGAAQATEFNGWSDTEIKVKVPDGVQPGKNVSVKVSAGGGDSAPGTLQVKPTIASITNPSTKTNSGIVGDEVVLDGSFGDTTGTVSFGGADAHIQSWTPKLKVLVPAKAPMGAVDVTVSTADKVASDPTKFTVNPDSSQPDPSEGQIGTPVNLTGHFGASGTVTLGSRDVDGLQWNNTSIAFNVPPVPPGKNKPLVITLSNVGGTLTKSFSVDPNIVDPTGQVAPGKPLTITGSFGADKGSVTIGKLDATPPDADWGAGKITVTVPSVSPGPQDIVVMSKDGLVSKAKKLTVKPSTPVPSLSSGAAGTEITINGTNFGDQQGSSTVTFGTVPATKIGPWAHDSIRVTVPDGVKKGQPNNIVVTVKNVQSDAADFTVP